MYNKRVITSAFVTVTEPDAYLEEKQTRVGRDPCASVTRVAPQVTELSGVSEKEMSCDCGPGEDFHETLYGAMNEGNVKDDTRSPRRDLCANTRSRTSNWGYAGLVHVLSNTAFSTFKADDVGLH
jgi:hypothetical protein